MPTKALIGYQIVGRQNWSKTHLVRVLLDLNSFTDRISEMFLNKHHTVVIAVVFLCVGLTWAGWRPTKRIKFLEADGAPEGKLMFTIDRLSENEQFRISGYNPWVTVEPTGNVLVKRKWDYEKLDQEKIIDFWVTIAETKGKDLDNQRVIVQVKDVNDEPPYFINRPLPMQAVVQLNTTLNTPVFTLQARDPDTDHHIRYFLIQNTTGGRFEVDERSGVVHTRGSEPFQLDMEYFLYVKAEDHNGRLGDGRFQSTPEERLSIIGGKRRPQFYKSSYETKIPKNQRKDIEIISVRAKSFAEGEIRYTLKATGLGAGTFNIGPTTGNVQLTQDLDFDDLQQPHVYQLQVTATEDSNDVSTSVELTIHVTDLNKPIFSECSSYSPKIEEGAPNGSPVVRVQATDADKGVNGQVKYSIVQQPNQKGTKFTVDEETGEIFTNKVFDREGDDGKFVSVTVKATDQGDPSLEGVCSFTVEITDVNDNAPRFLKDYRPVLREHTPPRKIIEILATDDDDISKGNGPPFHFRMDPNVNDLIRGSFKVENYPKGANGDGMAIVTSLRMFNREHQKEFQVPIIIKDSGKPAKSSTSTLTVIIGDINDYKMQPGSKRIVVYNYMGQSPDMEIGRVNVFDLDDWDLPDKKFYWDKEEHKNFILHQDTGMLTMLRGTPTGGYNLRFRVFDYYLNQNNIPAVVTIIVKEISYEAVTNSGSIRIFGITDEDFIRICDYRNQEVVKSKIDKLRDKLAQLLAIDRENVDIFSVQLRQERPPITDIRFSTNVPPYYKPIILNGIVLQHREEIETEVGINITMVGINECLVEDQSCEGSCTNTMEVGPLPYMINSNKTALVGVQVDIKPECTCGALNLLREMSCRNNPCINGGSCIEDHSEITCQCQSGYEGPHCEQTSRSFFGNEWAWFPALEMCASSHLSIEFLVKNLDGTLLYNGPMIPPKPYETISSDFIAIELFSGNPRLLIDFGAGTLELVLESNDTYQLDDDSWHRIDVFWDTKNVRMVLDLCNSTSESEDRTVSYLNRTVCEVKDVLPPFNKYLDISSPLQIGGMSHPSLDPAQFLWDYYPLGERFNGSIRNVIHNSKIYDLAECEMTRSIWKMGSTNSNFPCTVKFSW